MNDQLKESDFQPETILLDSDNWAGKWLYLQVNPINKHIQFKIRWVVDNSVVGSERKESYHDTLQSAIEAYNQL